jgi:hypothetical protein
MSSLGFIVHPVKSVLVPTQELEFLGFILNSVLMTVCPTGAKATHIKQACLALIKEAYPTIRRVSQVLGYLLSSLPGVQYGRLHTRHLENCKIMALKINSGKYDSSCIVYPRAGRFQVCSM